MEEIYKPDADGTEKVEVYSRENNDMLGDMPEWLIHTCWTMNVMTFICILTNGLQNCFSK